MKKNNVILVAAAIALAVVSCNKEQPEYPEFEGIISTDEEVDLGLSVKWSGRNLGAENPCDCGTYFAWGEKSGKEEYTLAAYELYDSSTDTYVMEPGSIWENDPATAALGADWHVPTPEQLAELTDTEKCLVTKASYKGHKGWVVTSLVGEFKGTSIFFPTTGYKAEKNINNLDSQASVWSNRTEAGDAAHAANLFFEYSEAFVNTAPKSVGGTVWCGYPVRPVKNK